MKLRAGPDKLRDAGYWRAINPELRVTEADRPAGKPVAVPPTVLREVVDDVVRDGYFELPALLPAAAVRRLVEGVERLRRAGWHPTFLALYDEYWTAVLGLAPVCRALLGPGFRALPDFFVYHVGPGGEGKGWGPHRDKGAYSLRPDRTPRCINLWVALTDATPANGCMYVLPASLDPKYTAEPYSLPKFGPANLQDIRALPAVAGTVLGWTEAVVHWGGRCSPRATTPRVSIAMEFQRGDEEPYNTPLLDPAVVPSFDRRLGLIGKQLLQYPRHYNPPEPLRRLSAELAASLDG